MTRPFFLSAKILITLRFSDWQVIAEILIPQPSSGNGLFMFLLKAWFCIIKISTCGASSYNNSHDAVTLCGIIYDCMHIYYIYSYLHMCGMTYYSNEIKNYQVSTVLLVKKPFWNINRTEQKSWKYLKCFPQLLSVKCVMLVVFCLYVVKCRIWDPRKMAVKTTINRSINPFEKCSLI